jgi:hypothetical protein
MWYNNKKIAATFVHHTTQWAWANIDGIGWRRIKDGAADGCTNLYILLCAAKANDRLVNVYVDSDNLIETAYLL